MFSRWSRGETGLIYAKLMHMHPTYYHTSRTNVKILAPLSDARFSRTLDCPPSADSIVTFSTSFVWKKGGVATVRILEFLHFSLAEKVTSSKKMIQGWADNGSACYSERTRYSKYMHTMQCLHACFQLTGLPPGHHLALPW